MNTPFWSITHVGRDRVPKAHETPPMPNQPQAETVMGHLRISNPDGYDNLQEQITKYTEDRTDPHYSFTVNAEECGINEICCAIPQGGVKGIIFTQLLGGSGGIPWSKPFTGVEWQIDAQRLFGHMDQKMIPVKELIIDVKRVGDKYFVANITLPPCNDIVTFGSNRRGVSFTHLVGAIANPSFMDKQFNLGEREGISIKSGYGMDPLVKEELFKAGGDFIRLGDCAVELVRTAIMPIRKKRLASVYDIDMKKLRSMSEYQSIFGKSEHYPFLKFPTEADPHFKSFGPVRHLGIDSATNLILALDAPDHPEEWWTNPETWEILLTDFAEVCKRTI